MEFSDIEILWLTAGVLGCILLIICAALLYCCLSKNQTEDEQKISRCDSYFTNEDYSSKTEDEGSTFPEGFDIKSEHVQPSLHNTKWFQSPSFTTLTVPQPSRPKSVDSSDEEQVPSKKCGKLYFSVSYANGLLHVFLQRAKGLPGRGIENTLRDPFAKLFLLPDCENFQTSRVKRRTLTPKFQETFVFQISSEELPSRVLRITIYDIDKLKIRHCLGHVTFPLDNSKLMDDSIICKTLEELPAKINQVGHIQLALEYTPVIRNLKVSICKVKGIYSKTYIMIVVNIYHGEHPIKTKRTSVRPCRNVTIFEEIFNFSVSDHFFETCRVEFVVKELNGNKIGKTILGPFLYARGNQLLHWEEMLIHPRETVTKWHSLEKLNY